MRVSFYRFHKSVSKFLYSHPEDKLKCEHICDTLVYECIIGCNHDTQCMRNCWIEHDKCAINCPCNEECLDGCSEPYEGHPCDTWWCQGYIMGCAAKNDPDRIPCDGIDQNACESKGCCWVPYGPDTPGIPWCHQSKKIPIN